MSDKTTFAVGVAGGGIKGGVTFIDLATLSMTQKDAKGNPLSEVGHRIFLTPEAVIELDNFMRGVMDRMIESGILKRREGEEGGGPPQSPNFS